MKHFKNILSKFSNIAISQKIQPFLTRRNAVLAIAVLASLITYSSFQNHRSETVVVKPVSNHKKTTKTEAKPQALVNNPAATEETASEPDQATVTEPTPVTKKTTPSPKSITPAPIPQPLPVEFSLNVSEITVALGATSPVFQATSTNGQPLEWAVFGTNNGVFAQVGLTSEGKTLVHNFSFSANPYFGQPGTYQARVEGYIPGGQHVTKSITVTVIAAQT